MEKRNYIIVHILCGNIMVEVPSNFSKMEPIINNETAGKLEVRPYKPSEAKKVFTELEVPNWAPWLRASIVTLEKRAEVFPEGQIAIWKGEHPIANVSLVRFNYDGNPDNLKTWDELMGNPATGEKTYDSDGNAIGMMSINVKQDYQSQGLAKAIIDSVKDVASKLGVKYIMGSFRPTQFGEHSHKNPHANFTGYVGSKREDSLPTDAWLRILTRNGMKMLRIDDAAMVVPDVTREEFDDYRETYKPEKWKQISPGVWRCGETGLWFVGEKSAVYAESNVWGILENGNNSPPSK